jgi:hypothetical protein
MISRRIFLGAAVTSSYQLPRLSFAMPAMAPIGDEMHEALELLAPYAPSFRGGLRRARCKNSSGCRMHYERAGD